MVKNTFWYRFLIKNLGLAKFLFRVISIWSGQHKNLFSTLWYLYKSFMYQLKPVIAVQRFHIVTHSDSASPWTFFWIMLTSAVIYKQRFLHENEIVQLLYNYKCYDVDQIYFRKPLQSSFFDKRPVPFYQPFNL